MHLPIILIGPGRAGKSTQGALIAAALRLPHVSLDDIKSQYYAEIGWTAATQQRIRAAEGFLGVYRYWKQFEPHAVVRVLQEQPSAVIDFGAGHTVYEEPEALAFVQSLLEPYENVILLLPSPDPEESVRVLRERKGEDPVKLKEAFGEKYFDFTAHFVNHPSNYSLAKRIVYTQSKTPEETCSEICALLTGPITIGDRAPKRVCLAEEKETER